MDAQLPATRSRHPKANSPDTFKPVQGRGKQTIDARKQNVDGNATHGDSAMFNNQRDTGWSRDVYYSPKIYMPRIVNAIREVSKPGASPPRTRSRRSVMDISRMLSQFSPPTGSIMLRIRDRLAVIQGHHRNVRKSLKSLGKSPHDQALVCEGTQPIERMQVVLKRQRSLSMLTDREFLLFGTIVDATTSSDQTSSPTSNWAEELLRTLNMAENPLGAAIQQLEGLLSKLESKTKLSPKAITSRVQRCSANISKGGQYLKDFHAKFNGRLEELSPSENAIQQPQSLNEKETKDLQLLMACREVSTALCRQLGWLCDEHEEHHVYVNLEKIERIQQDAKKWIRFHLAFERCDAHGDGFVWIQAETVVNEESIRRSPSSQKIEHSPSPSVSASEIAHLDERPHFCIASLENGMNFKRRGGHVPCMES